jgi:serine/threonine protein kinase
MLVLFSFISRCWKIADFGATSEGTSKRLSATSSRRGTAVYSAPEVLQEGGYNRKSDVWVFGCIAYELCTKETAFRSDWEMIQYRRSSRKRVILSRWPKGRASRLARVLTRACVDDTPRFVWKDRPSAIGILETQNAMKGE